MNLEQYKRRIDKYLSKDEHSVFIVDVQNDSDKSELILHYGAGNNSVIHASDYCNSDGLPHFETLLNDLASENNVSIIEGFSAFLKLEGKEELQRFIRKLLGMHIAGHSVFVTYQCGQFLPVRDPRLSRRILITEGNEQKVPNVIFSESKSYVPPDGRVIEGINNMAEIESCSCDTVYIITKKHKDSIPHSIYHLKCLRDAYDAILLKDPDTIHLPKSLGTDSQWDYALKLFRDKSSWADVIDEEFCSHKMPETVFPNYKNFSKNKKWLYFIALKMYGSKNNWCLSRAAESSGCFEDFAAQIYNCILDKDIHDKDFWSCYESRKVILQSLGENISELSSYCKLVFSKGKNAIYFLTDSTQNEQEAIFAFLDMYGHEMNRTALFDVLSEVYPALYSYLQPYRFGNDLLDDYFQEYKYQKVINKILPEFEKLVEEQAVKREYNSIIPPRSSVIERLNKNDSKLYFMDAMGAEYLGYILSVCRELNMNANITVCSCELPSITSCNKDFLSLFEDVVSVKEIDDIKHHGKYGYDFYRNSKLPVHLIKELEVIRSVLVQIRNDLSDGKIQRAFMISDHGSSRLAVLHDTENVYAMSEKGLHSGRCCPKSDVDDKPDFAADAGDFWVLANYDRFKGSRKANVEVHGGAALEEICVPVIELTCLSERPQIILMPLNNDASEDKSIPEIKVSYRKKASIKIFSDIALQNLNLIVNNVTYNAVALEHNFYQVNMPDIKKPGTYYADVYSGNNLIAEHLPFMIQTEGQQEKTLL